MFKNLKLYMIGREIEIPDNFVCWEKGGNYLFELYARFRDIKDAEMFALMKSEKSRPYEMFSVKRNLGGDLLGEYYVYLVLNKE